MDINKQKLFLIGEVNIRLKEGMELKPSSEFTQDYQHEIWLKDEVIGGFAYVRNVWVRTCPRITNERNAILKLKASQSDIESARQIVNTAITELNKQFSRRFAA